MKKEPVGLLSKTLVIPFREVWDAIDRSKSPIRTSMLWFLVLGFINFLLLTSSILDFKKLPEAGVYDMPSILYAQNRDGVFEPIAEYYNFSRIPIILDKLPEEKEPGTERENKVIQAFLSTEDNSFYSHYGIDFKGIARAIVVNILAGRVKEGASTITQQVARLKFLTMERSLARKAREVWLAFLLEAYFSKPKILEVYLNEIPLGHGTIGVGAASRFYFRKEVSDISWGEAAILASLTTRPTQFSPIANPISSLQKVRVVFKKLIENGRLSVPRAEAEFNQLKVYYSELNRSPNDSAFSDRLNRFPYVTEYIRKILIRSIGKERLYNGGLKIYSTIQIHHQIEAEKAMAPALVQYNQEAALKAFRNVDVFDDTYGGTYDILALFHDMPDFRYKISRNNRTFGSAFQEELRDSFLLLNYFVGDEALGERIDKSYGNKSSMDQFLLVEGSLVSMRPETGDITALVGGSGFRSDNQQIRSFQALRQPGSAFKPILYSVAMDYSGKNPDPEKNVTPATLFADSPLQYLMEDGDEWAPENYSSEYSGFILLRKALEQSRNSVAVRVLEQVGLKNLMEPLTDLLQLPGRELPYNFSVSLGSFEMTPYELTRSFAALANGGKTILPLSVLYVEDKFGIVVKDFRKERDAYEPKQAISPEAAFLITSMMEGVIKEGTGKSILSSGLNRRAYGKTGTTNNFRDAWFVGYTPELVTSVWFGYDIGTISLGRGMTGGRLSAPVWGRYMAKALEKEPKKDFYWASDLKITRRTVCAMSGKPPGPQCRQTFEEIFLTPTVPKEICNDHGANWSVIPVESEDPLFKNPSSEKKKKKEEKIETKPKSNPEKDVRVTKETKPPKEPKMVNPLKPSLEKNDKTIESKKKKKKNLFSGDEEID